VTTVRPLAAEVGERLLARREWLALAESCTGGLVAKLCTDIAGSSNWFERGLVTYSNRAKQELLGVSEALLATHGAVSEACAGAMAHGLLKSSPADWAVAVTGIAGPGGGSSGKPVGTVWIGWMRRDHKPECRHHLFAGDREQVRTLSARVALQVLLEKLHA